MNKLERPSRSQAIHQVLEQADTPLTFDELLAAASALFPMDARGLKAGLNSLAHNDSQEARLLQRTVDGRYAWLPKLVPGATFRHTIAEKELKEQRLPLDPEMVTALFPNGITWGQTGSFTCQLPDSLAMTMKVERVGEKGWLPIWGTRGVPRFWEWLKRGRARAGDALLFKVEEAMTPRAVVTLEPAAARDVTRGSQRNAEVADAVHAVVKPRRDGARLDDLAARLIALGVYHDPCPPDSLQTVVDNDARFMWEQDRLKEATRYDHLYRDLGLQEPDLFNLVEARPTGRKRKRLTRKERADKVYRFRASFRHNKSLWRRIEIRGDQSLGELDREMRAAFGHDPMDHLSEFYLGVDADADHRGPGTHEPFGGGEGDAWQIGELGLAAGDELSYTYDFGDNIQHVLKLEAIVAPEPGAEYPRVVERNQPRYQPCETCQAEGRQEIATWICMECSNQTGRDVLLCEEHVASDHEEHYAEEIVY